MSMFTRTSENELNKLFAGISLLLCGVLLFGMLFSAFFVSKEFHHDCTGEDCPICQMVAICENFSHQLSSGLAFLASVIMGLFCIFVTPVMTVCAPKASTLVSYKVRLNN